MKESKGFTLIEVLVVVALLGILSSMGFVLLSNKRDEAARTACKANITTLNNAIMLYTFKESKQPDNLLSLVPHYLRSVPTCPLGQDYVYDKNTGEVETHSH